MKCDDYCNAAAGADDEAAIASASKDAVSTAPPENDLYEAVSADEGRVTVSSTHEVSAIPTDIDEAGPAEESTVMDSDGATSSRNSQKKPLKRMKRFFGRMFRAMCCCCSATVDE
ncbi:homeodomain-interacting protein kinase 2-like [Scomber scombrus]|uniref:Homeodomain-interacting protein kinase 2-like n=1 Tax=Scomber scombrus TaxID=13677 RepID=A0AAV1MWW8_SCOSC